MLTLLQAMSQAKLPFIFLIILTTGISCKTVDTKPRNYYISNNGSDDNDGSLQHPWKTIVSLASLKLKAGDSVLLNGNDTFRGTLTIAKNTTGSVEKPIVITSYGHGTATINSGNTMGIIIDSSTYMLLQNFTLKGAGRKDGNTASGLYIAHCSYIKVDSIEVSGYQKSGVLASSSSGITIKNVYAHDNGYAGISVESKTFSKTDCRNIEINHCRTENNAGDPSAKDNHSGNGIVVSQCTNLKIAYCTATNNGWDMPRIGNGPVGIWAWDADSVTIEHCISYRNKTSAGGEDGGGYDFDGGVTNSVIQYCLSYENEGSGIGIFQYKKAGPWYNNSVRYNISINDGRVSAAKAGIYIWNASYSYKLKDCKIYNNVVYNKSNAAIRYAAESENEQFVFYNNIFVGKDEIIAGKEPSGIYLGNNYWNFSGGFNINGIKDFATWANLKNMEKLNGKVVGFNMDPVFVGAVNLTDVEMLPTFFDYKTPAALQNGGVDLKTMFGITTGGIDFNGNAAPAKGVGASF